MKEKLKKHLKWKNLGWVCLIVIVAILGGKSWQHTRICQAVDDAIEAKEYNLAREKLKELPWQESKEAYRYIDYRAKLDETDDVIELYNTVWLFSGDETCLYGAELKALHDDLLPKYKAAYPAHLEEVKRQQEQEKIEREKEYKEKLKSSIPCEGMPEKYISGTAMGRPGKIKELKVHASKGTFPYGTEYNWYSSGKVVLRVTCVGGEVSRVEKFDVNDYWDKFEKQTYSTQKNITSGSTANSHIDEFYDAQDYDDPEDFYYENEDDFYDFEDAEDYWEDYH